MANSLTVRSKTYPGLQFTATPGHFVTSHSHINYYIDLTSMKHHHMMAREAGIALAEIYAYDRSVDTVICMDGSEVIGSFLAQKLSKNEMLSMNKLKDIHIVTPILNTNAQMIFFENLLPMVTGRNVLLLISSVTTGKTLHRLFQCVNYYGSKVVGVCALFSALKEVDGVRIDHLFSAADIPGYQTYSYRDCPHCVGNIPIDGLVNSYGITKV